MTDRERAICSRIKNIREQLKWSKTDFASELGISRAKLVSIESWHTPLRYDLAVKISRFFDVQTKWLATGNGEMRPWINLLWTAEQRQMFNENDLLTKVYDFAPGVFEPFPESWNRKPLTQPHSNFNFWNAVDSDVAHYCYSIKFHDVGASWDFAWKIGAFLKKLSKRCVASGKATRVTRDSKWAPAIISQFEAKKDLTKGSEFRNISGDMKLPRTMEQLLAEVRRLTEPAGMKAALAKYLVVPQARVSEWLAGKYKPSGQVTLKLALWVSERRERQPK